jgi:hypothetical protein
MHRGYQHPERRAESCHVEASSSLLGCHGRHKRVSIFKLQIARENEMECALFLRAAPLKHHHLSNIRKTHHKEETGESDVDHDDGCSFDVFVVPLSASNTLGLGDRVVCLLSFLFLLQFSPIHNNVHKKSSLFLFGLGIGLE